MFSLKYNTAVHIYIIYTKQQVVNRVSAIMIFFDSVYSIKKLFKNDDDRKYRKSALKSLITLKMKLKTVLDDLFEEAIKTGNFNYHYAAPYSFSTAGYIFSLPILVLS